MNDLALVITGGLVGAFISPLLLEMWRQHQREKRWARPRKELLRKMLSASNRTFTSIERLSRTIGASEDETRSLLIELDARGGRMKSGKEAWALISRAPLDQDQEPADDF
ncbi:hypothetical protein [Pontivivens insulae]|uniref:Uncharacterized protein n=1 Tax=Pontivivens insulae TaxID=1639689 RepID=A0A2R8A880_9RHOB|nr:hypothetical protein [Pontivivens insulae]RED18543.1 hypothetical protein DFR53_0740 [Pontivivens insulae]SPF28441.1 hypothetical protein POI8812_00741 [Pontivivens insulae]